MTSINRFALVLVLIGLAVPADSQNGRNSKRIEDVSYVAGLDPFPIEGVGLVIRLKGTGSNPIPSPERTSLVQEMLKRGVNPEEFLSDPNTALVRVYAYLPSGARSCKSRGCWCRKRENRDKEASNPRLHLGETFDIRVEAPERDLTKSLEGGWLLEAWLYETASLGHKSLTGHVFAKAAGPVVVAPGDKKDDGRKLRQGLVLGGGVTQRDLTFGLMTDSKHQSAHWTVAISTRINERWQKNKDNPVATAKSSTHVPVEIPRRYQQNIGRFFEVVGRIPAFETPNQEVERTARLAEQLLDPKTSRGAAIELEGIGRRAGTELKAGLASSDPDVRFFAAETLAYLGDRSSATVLAETARNISEYRAHALVAFTALDEPISRIKLMELMRDTESRELRYGSFRALHALDENDPALHRERMGYLDVYRIPSNGSPFVNVSTRSRTEIVIFGQEPSLKPPFLLHAGPRITISSGPSGQRALFSKYDIDSDTQRSVTNLDMASVIRGTLKLGVDYAGLWSMLIEAEESNALPGKLELDVLPDPYTINVRLAEIYSENTPTAKLASNNLFRWREPRDRVKSRSGKESEADETDEEEKGRPSFLRRLFRRTAN